MCRLRAISFGVQAKPFIPVDTKPKELFKEVEVDAETFNNLSNLNITDQSWYQPETMSYLIRTDSGKVCVGAVVNNKLDILDDKDLARQEVTPMNLKSKILSHAILNCPYDIIVATGVAGTSKTMTTISSAMRLVRQKQYPKIIYIRNTVSDLQKEEEIGFLKGDLSDKTAHFFAPLKDTLRFFVEQHIKSSKLKPADYETVVEEKITEFISKYNIECLTTLGLRGRTLNNAIVIVDEASNLSISAMQTLLTRIGKKCKVVVVGSQTQIDNEYLTKYTNGLAILLDAIGKDNEIRIFGIELDTVVRSEITKFAERIFVKE